MNQNDHTTTTSRLPESVYRRRRAMVLAPFLAVLMLVAYNTSEGVADAAGNAPSVSWYVSWAHTDGAVERAERIGCEQGEKASDGTVFLGFGRQRDGGPSGFTDGVVPYARIAEVAASYARGLQRCSDGTWVVAVMTSNHKLDDIATAERQGREWGELARSTWDLIGNDKRITIAAGSDVEPAWGSYAAASAWAVEAHKTGARLAFTPSADGCPTSGDNGCSNGWNPQLMATLMWGVDADAAVMPQIYRSKMAQQWGRIATVGRDVGLTVVFAGALSQQGACQVTGQRPCLDIGPLKAQAFLQDALGEGVPHGSDISW
jgi:hypothetical protein